MRGNVKKVIILGILFGLYKVIFSERKGGGAYEMFTEKTSRWS